MVLQLGHISLHIYFCCSTNKDWPFGYDQRGIGPERREKVVTYSTMWSRSYCEHSIYHDVHRLSLYIDIAESIKNKSYHESLLNIVRKEKLMSDSMSSGVGFHVLFFIEIDIETDEDEIDEKIEHFNTLRRDIEKIYCSTEGDIDDIDTEISGNNIATISREIDAVSTSNIVDRTPSLSSKVEAKKKKRETIVRKQVEGASSSNLIVKSAALKVQHKKNMLVYTVISNIISPIIMTALSDQSYYKQVTTFLLGYQIDRQRTVDRIVELINLYGNGKSHLKFGLGFDVPFDEMHWILLKIPQDSISVVSLGFVNYLPNLYLRQVELVHSLGYNTLLIIRHDDVLQPANRLEYLSQYSKKYEFYHEDHRSNLAFLVKALLQFGLLIGVSIDLPTTVVTDDIFALKHPFAWRKKFSSPTDVKTFILRNEDILAIAELSEECESTGDRHYEILGTHRKPPRELSNDVIKI